MSTTAQSLWDFEDSYVREVPSLSLPWQAAPVAEPDLVVLNEALAAELGVDPAALREPDGLALLVGRVPEGVTTVAQLYSGHQFGNYSPRLGDGRALLLGEIHDVDGRRRDLHLKGSGRTPFARGGDGLAALGPMLREYLMGEAMHALGVPTSRALAVVATGERLPRETGLLPGAVLARVAASHLRVGTFQWTAANEEPDVMRALADHAIARHHPEAAQDENRYLAFFRAVVEAQAALVAQWMLVGFIHGVMNTDNTTISGETIDYGPCAFMDAHDPATVFSSIDRGGRYAYGRQPQITQWNLARLGETLLPLIGDDADTALAAAVEVLESFASRYADHWFAGMAAKIGLAEPDRPLIEDLPPLLTAQQVDHTNFFRALARGTARDLFVDREPFDAWAARRDALLPADREAVAAGMDRVNPAYIPRNHLVEDALTAATAGDLGPFERLLDVLARPYDERPGLESYTEPGTGPYVTYCGT